MATGILKTFGMLYSGLDGVRLAPMFDVVTTSIHRYTRYEGRPELEDRTLALELFSGKRHTRAYPTTEEPLRFGSAVCGVARPALADRADPLLGAIAQARAGGMAHATSRPVGRRCRKTRVHG